MSTNGEIYLGLSDSGRVNLPLRMANRSMSVDLPIRLRPRQVTNEGTRLCQSASKSAIRSSRPKNALSFWSALYHFYSLPSIG